MSLHDRVNVAALLLLACASACATDSGGGGGSGGSTSSSSSSSSGGATSGVTTTSGSTASSTSATSTTGGEGGVGDGGGTATGGAGAGGMMVDPAHCAAQLTEGDCHAAGCNAWLSYEALTVPLDRCSSETVGPLCLHYTNPVGNAAWRAFTRLFDAEIPQVLGDSSGAVPDGWVSCGEPGSEGVRACCCYSDNFGDGTCDGIQSDLP